jgi:hypothetical protein
VFLKGAQNIMEKRTYEDVFDDFISKITNEEKLKVDDYRPADILYIEDVDWSSGIIVWLKDGSKFLYVPPKEEQLGGRV